MTEISGYVEIPSNHLKIACKNYLEFQQLIKAFIDVRREELIQKEMSRKGWFGRPKVQTRAEAVANLKVEYDPLSSPWEHATHMGSYWADKVRDLQDAACLAPSVLVEVNMASLLKPYFAIEHVAHE